MLLQYETQIFLDSFHEDGLAITASGLGIDRILLNYLKVYNDPGNLVLVLNTTSVEEEYFIECLLKEDPPPKSMPKIITNEYSTNERQSVYLEGGVLFVTSRILVVDMLTDRLPTEMVTGILVYKAHKIIESCQEAFILRLFRQKNKQGFIKALSDSPQSFTIGFCHVERVMKNLFVRNLYLWPRFQADIVAFFDRHKPEVIELHLQMTTAMIACQTAILDLINQCIKELVKCNPTIDTEEITTENALTKNFEKIIRHYLDPVWHQLGARTKQLVADIKTMRLLLRHLIQYDSVTFYSLVNSIRKNEMNFGQNSGWLFMDSADSLYIHARERIYGVQKKMKSYKAGADANAKAAEEKKELVLEECPKWQALKEVLKEIEDENKNADEELGPGKVLIAAEDDRTCSQIRQYLCEGGLGLLTRLYEKQLAGNALKQKPEERKKYPLRKGKRPNVKKRQKAAPDPEEVTLTQMYKNQSDEEEITSEEDHPKEDFAGMSKDGYYHVIPSPVTIIHPLHGCTDPYNLSRTLHEIQPRYVILYDADMIFVRQLEVFKASRPDLPLRVYFLMYTGSTEEQRYLTSLRKEKEAFEYLIKEKATMVIPEEREGKQEDDQSLARDATPANETVGQTQKTRKGGKETEEVQQRVIVDMREFRSELPSLIHRRGIDIEPVTIEVGDYILTPDICVERKSVSDLIGSLNNGRLYNQCVSMTRYYRRPILLIEFDQNKAFSLLGKYGLSNDMSLNDVLSKLTLLTLHFPRLRILWCASPYATAELFEEIKAGREQPDAAAAMKVQEEMAGESEFSDKYSHGPQDMLLKMPGVNTKNYRDIMNKVENIQELCTTSQEELAKILGNAGNAKLLWEFLHKEQDNVEVATGTVANKTGPSKHAGRGRGRKRKR
ncbi:DNA repair endonuclease XPF-like [Lineus longissimus]|uniref:DNA repair endonuclease XPF-like n=1 Tax=Lineus longissimus TaxID=88925 RepID=UPI002B4E2FB1